MVFNLLLRKNLNKKSDWKHYRPGECDNEEVVPVFNGTLLIQEKKEIALFTAPWMDLDICHAEWNKSERERQIP